MKNLEYCINYLKNKNQIHSFLDSKDFNSLRALMNITMPLDLSEEYYIQQDFVLKDELSKKTIVDIYTLEYKNKITIYKGDITLIKADAIVNACNEKLLGCFQPLHSCIDNAIHSFAGLQVRRDLIKIMNEQGHDEPNGKCKVTKGYNLPAKYIFHTVGPKVFGYLKKSSEIDLKNCYESCLYMAEAMKLRSIVFPCISTGIYGYPNRQAAYLAYQTVIKYLEEHPTTSLQRIIFNVFKEEDYLAYQRSIEEAH